MIYMITEHCEGGEMMPYLSKAFQDTGGLRTEDVSRISYQLWSAVNHCAKHNVIHRDIKPENVMFCNTQKDSELRLIDFGSGTYDGAILEQREDGSDVDRHHTFAGSAFYISPEMFQRNYTPKTDVWSAGATLYVLVAGYPADRLQETFNILQSNDKDRLRKLPNMPDKMPDSYYDMLEGALTYKHKARSTAGQLMAGEFAQFHIQHDSQETNGTISFLDIAAEAAGRKDVQEQPASPVKARTKSVLLEGSVYRHNAYLGYQRFERSVTTVLATMLSKANAKQLLTVIEEESKKESTKNGNVFGGVEFESNNKVSTKTNKEKLQVVTIETLIGVLEAMKAEALEGDDIDEAVKMIRSLKDFKLYESFAYHISFLRQFVSTKTRTRQGSKKGVLFNMDGSNSIKHTSSVHGGNVWSSMRVRRGLGDSSTRKNNTNGMFANDMSVKSVGGLRRVNTATGTLSTLSSVA
jgi:serine/threonine protein kinase